MAKRQYKKRTASTKSKSYADYLKERVKLEEKGYMLKTQLSEADFKSYYKTLQEARKAGELKSTAWQTLKEREKYVSTKQTKTLQTAVNAMKKSGFNWYATDISASDMELISRKKKLTELDIRKLSPKAIFTIGEYLNENKEDLYSGNYE